MFLISKEKEVKLEFMCNFVMSYEILSKQFRVKSIQIHLKGNRRLYFNVTVRRSCTYAVLPLFV